MLKISLIGKHSNRTPFWYPDYKRHFGRRLVYTVPLDADVLVFGMGKDILQFAEEDPEGLPMLRKKKVWVVSEEPLWDTVWSNGQFGAENYDMGVKGHSIRVNQVGFFSRNPYDGEFPYFLTTDDRYFEYYKLLFEAKAKKLVPPKMPMNGFGLLEYRDEEVYDVRDATGNRIGLCRYRTLLAQFLARNGMLYVAGKNWPGQQFFPQSVRQHAADFHLQKLVALDGQFGFVLALENTLHRNYATEKAFDALAVGSVPICYLRDEHDLTRILSSDSLFDVSRSGSFEDAQKKLAAIGTAERHEMVAVGVSHAVKLFCDFRAVVAARERLVGKIVGFLQAG